MARVSHPTKRLVLRAHKGARMALSKNKRGGKERRGISPTLAVVLFFIGALYGRCGARIGGYAVDLFVVARSQDR